jgi:maleylpyruvate isomerase
MREQPGRQELAEVELSTDLFLASVDALREGQVREPTLLPDWTRGRLLTHMSRTAESLCRLLDWARTGVEPQQEPSADARARDSEVGAGRSVHALAVDLRATATLFDDAARALPDPAWSVEVMAPTGEQCTPHRIVFIRLRELEVHHVDLDVGYGWVDIPADVATRIVDDILGRLATRDDAGRFRIAAIDVELEREIGHGGPLVTGEQAALLAWLSGRSPGTGLTVEGAAAVPVAPAWL